MRPAVLIAMMLPASLAAAVLEAPDREVLEQALTGYRQIVADGAVPPGSVLTIIDYSLPSTEKRLFVYDPEAGEVLRASLVAHGKNSGQNLATSFGNEHNSLQSSLGFFVTGETYHGRHGYSLRLRGLEPGINDNAAERFIVIHGAHYVSQAFIKQYGRLGRSWGCPALPEETSAEIIDMIKEGTCVFIHGEDSTYRERSVYSGPSAP